MKRWVLIAACLVAVCALTWAEPINLYVPGSSGYLAGSIGGTAYFFTNATQGTGTGNLRPFLKLQASGNATLEQGYNSDFPDPYYDENNPASPWNHSVMLDDLAVINRDGVDYYVFFLDVDQQGGGRFNPENPDPGAILSLTDLRVGVASAGDLSGPVDGLAVNWAWRMRPGDMVNIYYRLDSGSGGGDVDVYIPTSAFGAAPGDYLYLYSRFGCTECSNPPYAANDGPEEWAYASGVEPIPEPATLYLIGPAVALLGVKVRNRMMSRQAVRRSKRCPAVAD